LAGVIGTAAVDAVSVMTPQQKELVQHSFALLSPVAEQAGPLFYARLFQLDPGLRHLFPGDLRDQSRKLMQMLAVAVRGLDHLEEILPAVRLLGQRHAGYGIVERDFGTVGVALLWTLQRGLGPAFTPDVRDAWAAVYVVLTEAMREGFSAEPVDRARVAINA
jgi:hemoglobin-like flavoprotein